MWGVLFIIRRLDCGGAERQLLELLRGMDNKSFDIHLLCLYPGGLLWEEAHSIPSIKIVHLGKRGRWDIGSVATLWKYIRHVKPQIVHGYLGIANVLSLIGKLFGARVVWGVRGSRVELSHYGFAHRIVSWVEHVASRFVDLIICNSEAARLELIASGYPPTRMMVIPNGIDVARFRPDPVGRQALRAEWRVAPNDFLIGLVARMDPVKGHRVFMAAANRISKRHANAKFVLVGNGPEPQCRDLRTLAETLKLGDSLIWAGERPDMPAVMSALDLSVSASLSEGFSNTLCESMACGVPCVATNVGDSGKIVRDFGWLAEPGDEAGLAEQIEAAMRHCRSAEFRPELVRRRIERDFSLTKLVETTSAALRSLPVSVAKE